MTTFLISDEQKVAMLRDEQPECIRNSDARLKNFAPLNLSQLWQGRDLLLRSDICVTVNLPLLRRFWLIIWLFLKGVRPSQVRMKLEAKAYFEQVTPGCSRQCVRNYTPTGDLAVSKEFFEGVGMEVILMTCG